MSTSLFTKTLKAQCFPWASGPSLVSVALRIKSTHPYISLKVLHICPQTIISHTCFLTIFHIAFALARRNCFCMDTCTMVDASLILSPLRGMQDPITLRAWPASCLSKAWELYSGVPPVNSCNPISLPSRGLMLLSTWDPVYLCICSAFLQIVNSLKIEMCLIDAPKVSDTASDTHSKQLMNVWEPGNGINMRARKTCKRFFQHLSKFLHIVAAEFSQLKLIWKQEFSEQITFIWIQTCS